MKVSIVTISYNQVLFLEQAISSVLEQNYPEIEFIVVDPGSVDGSRDIIEKYRRRISKIILESDNGPAEGLKKGFRCATGQIYGFLNSDDFLLPGAISHVVNCFQTNPNVDVVTGHAIVVDASGHRLRKIYGHSFSLIESAYNTAFAIQPSTFFRASAYLETDGFNIQNHTAWDDELFIDMKLRGMRFRLTNKFLSAYRVHSSSITGKPSDTHRSNIIKYRKERFERIMGREQNRMDDIFRKILWGLKPIRNPKETFERICHGPVYERYKHSKGQDS
jgi:glycosyltransferase involved in cell wall biosynthesis